MRTILLRTAASIVAIYCPIAGARADQIRSAELPQRVWPSQSQRYQPVLPPCTCRAMGREYLVGESICLRNGSRARRAICGMDINVTTWSMTDESCETSALAAPIRH